MRLCNVLVSLLVAGCLVPANNPPQQASQSPPPEPAQVRSYSQPPPIIEPQSEPYQLPPTRTTQPIYYDEPGYDTVNVNVTGDSVGSIDVFFDQLDPYGTWYDDPTYGWAFSPSQSSYVPYSNGYWKYTDYGVLWVSRDPFGWATDHYGRWVYQNRWVWTPDLTWGPAWVSWRQGDGWIGWAPAGYTANAYVPEDHWRFVAAPELFSIEISRRYAVSNIRGYLDASVPIVRYHRHDNDVWVAGPSEDWMRRNRLDVRRERAEAIDDRLAHAHGFVGEHGHGLARVAQTVERFAHPGIQCGEIQTMLAIKLQEEFERLLDFQCGSLLAHRPADQQRQRAIRGFELVALVFQILHSGQNLHHHRFVMRDGILGRLGQDARLAGQLADQDADFLLQRGDQF
jgi:hypothetical protein